MAFDKVGPSWRNRLCAVLGVTALVLLSPTATGVAQERAGQQQPASLPALQVVVLVDESGSLKPGDVGKEKDAARTIGASTLAPGSVVSVVGFGSSNGPGQSAVHVVCPPTVFDSPQKRDSLATCIGGLHRRGKKEGDGTDHVAALQQALDFIRAGGPDKKLVFLLTDGKLDVSNSPAWGDTAERRNGAAAAKVKEVLSDLNKAGAQVWPLGFGTVDSAALSGFARGKSCTPTASNPHEQIVPTAQELRAALQNAFSSASCVKYGPTDVDTIPEGGGSVDLNVDIPAVASDASIVVYKRDPRVQVEYRAPNADKPAPAQGGTDFEFAGQSTETESLRITDPEPGRWTVHLSSADLPAQDVAATVVYQAAVKAYLTISPPQPAAGENIDINMQVWARGKTVTDPETLRGLSFVATLTGSADFRPRRIELTDADKDGTFAGRTAVPDDISGDLTVTGQVTGIGIGGDTRKLSTRVQNGPAAIQAQILLDSNEATVTPGGSVSGTVSVTNDSGQPARLRLGIADPAAGTALTVEPATIAAAPGISTTDFTLRFGAGTALGTNAATLRLVDEANPDLVVAQRLYATEVAPEPTIVEKLFWLWVGIAAAVVVGLLFLLFRLRSRREAAKVRGLKAQLVRDGVVVSTVEPRDPADKAFRFVLLDDFTGPHLEQAGPGDSNVYEVRRAGSVLRFTAPGNAPTVIAKGDRRDVGRDLMVSVVDERGMSAADTPVTGPVEGVSFNPFDGPPATAVPVGQNAFAHVDPFSSAPEMSTNGTNGGAHAADPFGGGTAAADSWESQPATPANEPYIDPNNPFR